MTHDREELIACLRKVESGAECGPGADDFGGTTNWHRNPEGPQAADLILSLLSDLGAMHEKAKAANDLRVECFKALLNDARVMVAPGEEPDAIRRLAAEAKAMQEENGRLADSNEGLTEDLYQAVLVAYRRGAHEWAWLNYPQWRDALTAGQEVAPIARQALSKEPEA